MQTDHPASPFDAKPATVTPHGPSTFIDRYFKIFAWGYALALTLLSRIWTIKSPGPADSELFAYIGREWSKGVIPYRDIWDNKPPGIFAVNAVAAALHKQLPALALFEFLAIFATILLVVLILSELGSSTFAKWAAPFVAASILTIPSYTPGGDLSEIYILPFAAGCIYCFLRATRDPAPSMAWLLLSGASAAMAGSFKPVGLASLFAVTVCLLIDRSRSLFSRITGVALTWIGACIVGAVISSYFAAHHAFHQMADASFFYNLHYGAATHYSFPQSILLMIDRLFTVGSVLGCALAWFLFWLWPKATSATSEFFTRRQQAAALLFFLWLAADLFGARLGGRYYAHYFLPALLSIVVISCIAIDVLVRLISPPRYAHLFVYVLLIPIGVTALKGQIDEYHAVAGNPTEDWMKAAWYIRDHKNPSDTLFTWQFRPGIYRLADSHTLTRWESAHYINDFPEAYASIGSELMTELRSAPPGFIVDDCSLPSPKPNDTVRLQFLDLLSRYQLVYRAGGVCVFQHP